MSAPKLGMTVRELMEKLRAFDPELPVVTPDHEMGDNVINDVMEVEVEGRTFVPPADANVRAVRIGFGGIGFTS